MPSYLDLGVLGVVFVSALLSMLRGFTREVSGDRLLGGGGGGGLLFLPLVLPLCLSPISTSRCVAQAAAAAIVFFVTLIVVSLFTVRLSDAILDSKIGALDRSLGFVFGAARGFLLGVVAFAIFNWLVGDKQQPEWVQERQDPADPGRDSRPHHRACLPRTRRRRSKPGSSRRPRRTVRRARRRGEARRRRANSGAVRAPRRAKPGAVAEDRLHRDRDKLDALINSKVTLAAARGATPSTALSD